MPDDQGYEYVGEIGGMTVYAASTITRGTVVEHNGELYVHPLEPAANIRTLAHRYIRNRAVRMTLPPQKYECRACSRPFPSVRPLDPDERYCGPACREKVKGRLVCGDCDGAGTGPREGEKCPGCYGTTFRHCDLCGEDYALRSTVTVTPDGDFQYLCAACYAEEEDRLIPPGAP